MNDRWIRVTTINSIPRREGRAVTIGGRELAIFNLGPSTGLGASPSTGLGAGPSTQLGAGPSTGLGAGPSTQLGGSPSTGLGASDRFLAVENRCPHQGGPLSDGIVSGCTVVCPLHAWKVRLDTGSVDRPAAHQECVRTFTTRVEDGVVMVLLPALVHAPDGAERAA